MTAAPTVSERIHALDAIRAFALLGGIFLHAAMSFLPGFEITGLPLVDNSPSTILAVVFFIIHQFRMMLFFLIAGFFGHLAFHRRGLKGFVIDRLKRITVPFVVGWIILFPLIVAAIIFAAVKLGRTSEPPPAPLNPDPLPFPLTHLWFLYVLQWLYLVTLVTRGIMVRLIDRSGAVRSWIDQRLADLTNQPWAVLFIAAPMTVVLFLQELPPWFGIKTPDSSLIPNWGATIVFTMAFGIGWLICRQPGLLNNWKRDAMKYLIASLVMTIVALCISGPNPDYDPGSLTLAKFVFAACYAISAWCLTFGLIGIGMRHFSELDSRVRYLADSSYWLYLIHIPLIFFAQALLMQVNLHWTIKFPMILATTIPIMLLSYHYLVRRTVIGAMLNGRRYLATNAAR